MESIPQYVLLALGLIANLCLFLSLKREVLRQGRKHRHAIDVLAVCLKEVAGRETPAGSPPPTARSGVNLSRRTQAMRLLRRGEDVARIAEALGVPYKEAELLIRVQRMAADHSAVTPIDVTQM
jgi:hypothetical protein